MLKSSVVISSYTRCRNIKGALAGLRQSLATKSPLKMMTDAFDFILKAIFILKIFKFLS